MARLAPGGAAADIAEGVAVRVPKLEGVVARCRDGRHRQHDRLAADIDEGLGIDRVVVGRGDLLELGPAQVAHQTELVDGRLRVALGHDVGAGAPAHQLFEQHRRIAPDDGVGAQIEGLGLRPGKPAQVRRRGALVFGDRRQWCQATGRSAPTTAARSDHCRHGRSFPEWQEGRRQPFGIRILTVKLYRSSGTVKSSAKLCSYCAVNCTGVVPNRCSLASFTPSGRLTQSFSSQS